MESRCALLGQWVESIIGPSTVLALSPAFGNHMVQSLLYLYCPSMVTQGYVQQQGRTFQVVRVRGLLVSQFSSDAVLVELRDAVCQRTKDLLFDPLPSKPSGVTRPPTNDSGSLPSQIAGFCSDNLIIRTPFAPDVTAPKYKVNGPARPRVKRLPVCPLVSDLPLLGFSLEY